MSNSGRFIQATIMGRLFGRPVAVASKIWVLTVVLLGATFYTTTASAVCNGPMRVVAAVSKTTVNESGGDSVILQIGTSCQAHTDTIYWEIIGSAVNGTDYQPVTASGSTTISTLGTHNIATIVPIDNSIRDVGRTVTFHIISTANGRSPTSATTTIIDDDTPRVSVTASDAAASETGPGTGTFTVTLDRYTGLDETVAYTMSGDAANGVDYTLSAGTASGEIAQTSDADFNAGTTGANTAVVYDAIELAATITPGPGPAELTGTETGLKGLWHVNGDWLDASGNANDGTAYNGATFGAAKLGTFAATWDGVNDYVAMADTAATRFGTASLTIELWMNPAAFTSTDNPNVVRWFSKSNYCAAWSTTPSCNWLVAQILSDGRVNFGGRGYGDSGAFSMTAPVGSELPLNQWSHVAIVIDRSVSPVKGFIYINGVNTSGAGVDLTNLVGNLDMVGGSFQIGAAYAEYQGLMDEVAVFGRALSSAEVLAQYDGSSRTYASSGTFTSSVMDLLSVQSLATMSYTSNLPAGTGLSVDVRAGDSAVPDGSWTAWQPNVANGGDISSLGSHRYVQYRVNLSTTDTSVTPALDDVTVTYVSGTPMTVSGSDITLPAGSTHGTVTLTPIDDSADEYDEVATLTIGNLGGATTPGTPASASVTIADNDLPEVNVVVASDGAEQGGTPGSFTVSRIGILDAPLTVNYSVGGTATAGSDYTALSGTVTIPAGSGVGTNSATVSFTPINDALIEGMENISLTLSTDAAYVIGTSNTATANIADNDTDGTSRVDTSGIFVQSDWATTAPADPVSCTSYSGTWTGSACIGIHADNQNSWSTFSAAGSGLDTAGTAGQVTEVPTPQQWVQTDDGTSDRGFRANDYTTTDFATVSGFGDAADVTLAPIDNGDGSDGAFNSATYNGVSIPGITGTAPNITINTNEASHLGVYNFTDFKVAAGDTVTVTGSRPLKLYVTLSAKIDGTLNASASGRSGRAGGGNGASGPYDGVGVGPAGIGGGGPPDNGTCPGCTGGGGGGHAVAGFDATSSDAVTYPPGLGGAAYGDDPAVTILYGGSGGGGNYITGDTVDCSYSNPYGGGGGGVVLIQAGETISVNGLIAANGGAGSNSYHRSAFGSCGGYTKGPGGGGAGGTIKLLSTTIALASGGTRLSATGGSGSGRSGAGGGGRIRLEAVNLSGQAQASAGTGTVSTAGLASAFIAAGTGSYTSHVQYMGNINGAIASPGVWSTMSWNENVPAGTTLTVSVHSCAASDCSDRGASDWSSVVNGQDISSLTFVDDAHAYIQYKVDMTTSGGTLPRLHDLAINAISYGGGVWFQSDDSSGDTGFNKAGAAATNALVAGNGDSASVVLGGLAAGTGADGDFDSSSYDGSSIAGIAGVAPNITIDTDEASHAGVYNFASFTVAQGDTVRVRGSNAFILKSLGNVKVNGALNADGYSGDAGGFNGVAGPGAAAGGAGCSDGGGLGAGAGIAAGNSAGGGGAGHASAGSVGETSYSVAGGAGGLTYGDAALPTLEGGSGGGGSAVPSGTCANAAYGGGGGGAVEIISGDSVIVGAVGLISVDGGAGGSRAYSDVYAGGGGGGGSAGSLDIDADQIILNNPAASLSARGGQGGSSYFFGAGGDGGDGRIDLTATSIQGSASINVGGGSLATQSPTPATPVNGSYVSAIYDAGYEVSWEPIYWVTSIPTGTTLSISVHSCALSDCSDRGPSDWSVASKTQDLSSLAYVDDGHQYIQYRVDMSSDGRSVPRLDSVAINLKQNMGGSALVSSIYDTQDNANQIVYLEWTADTSGPGTAVQFQLRTSPDGVTWGPWYGPTSTSDYYTVSGSTINPVHADGVGDRYVQYKAVLVNGNPEYTPVLQDVTLTYQTYGSGAVVSSGGSFGSGTATGNAAARESSGGGGALGAAFLTILLLGIAMSARRSRQLGLKAVALLGLMGISSTAYSAFVLNFSAANPVAGGAYKTYTVGDVNGNFYQEFIIQKGFGQWQGDTGTASGGSRASSTDPLGVGGTSLSGTGNATGNPSKVIIWQRNRSSDMLLDFLKDDFGKKPRIVQTVITNDMLSEFSVDMRGLSYADNTTVAPVINTLTVSGQTTYPAQSATWDMAADSQNSHIDAGLYTYTAGSGPGGSIGTYNFNEGNFPIYSTDWSTFFDKTDPSNVWTNSTNKPK